MIGFLFGAALMLLVGGLALKARLEAVW